MSWAIDRCGTALSRPIHGLAVVRRKVPPNCPRLSPADPSREEELLERKQGAGSQRKASVDGPERLIAPILPQINTISSNEARRPGDLRTGPLVFLWVPYHIIHAAWYNIDTTCIFTQALNAENYLYKRYTASIRYKRRMGGGKTDKELRKPCTCKFDAPISEILEP